MFANRVLRQRYFSILLGTTAAATTTAMLFTYHHNNSSLAFAEPKLTGNRKKYNFISDAVQVAQPSLAHVTNTHHTLFGEFGTAGSGFVISKDGFVATNAHVVLAGGADELRVTLVDKTEYPAEVWAVDVDSDLALLKLNLQNASVPNPAPLVPAVIGKSSDLSAGEWVIALGSPLNLQNSVTCGVVSAISRRGRDLQMPNESAMFLQTDASINVGNSGGPLINLDGEVVGINTMKAAGLEGISFSIPIDVAWPVLEQLKEFRKVRRPYIGLRMVTITPHVARLEGKNIPSDQIDGVLVVQVAPGSPSERSGLLAGDVIVKIDSKPVKDTGDVISAIGTQHGKSIEIQVRRKKEFKTVNVITENGPTVTY